MCSRCSELIQLIHNVYVIIYLKLFCGGFFMKNTILKRGSVAVAVLGIGALLSACGGGGSGSGSSSSSGSGFTTTSAYIQDDPSKFPEVKVGIYSMSIANRDGKACVLFSSSTPVYIDLASLSGIAQYMSKTACPSDSAYNRLDIVLSKTVSVITPVNYSSTMCTLTSYTPNAGSSVTLPNTVECGSGSTCTLYMTGNIGALSGTDSYVDIDFDFDLKRNHTTIHGTNCKFSFAIRPKAVKNKHKPHHAMVGLRGYIEDLSNTTFHIVNHHHSYTVVYSPPTSSVYSLLQSASSNNLKVIVGCNSFNNNICTASIIIQRVSGVYEGNSNNSLMLLREGNASDTITLFNPTIYPTSYTWSSFTSDSSYLLDVNKCNVSNVSNCTSHVYSIRNR